MNKEDLIDRLNDELDDLKDRGTVGYVLRGGETAELKQLLVDCIEFIESVDQ